MQHAGESEGGAKPEGAVKAKAATRQLRCDPATAEAVLAQHRLVVAPCGRGEDLACTLRPERW